MGIAWLLQHLLWLFSVNSQMDWLNRFKNISYYSKRFLKAHLLLAQDLCQQAFGIRLWTIYLAKNTILSIWKWSGQQLTPKMGV